MQNDVFYNRCMAAIMKLIEKYLVESITVVYNQTFTVYEDTPLDDLKADLVVTAEYADGTTEEVPADRYTLSGELVEGTSTVTVSYGGQTDSFSVTVTQYTPSYVTNGLIHHWDAIDNTGSGHDSSASVWADLVGNNNLTILGSSITWGGNYLNFGGTTGHKLLSANNAETSGGKTVEVVFKPDSVQSAAVICAFCNEENDTADSNAYGKINIYSDNTINCKGESSSCYQTGLAALTDLNSISASYSANTTISACYVNAVAKTANGATHSLRGSSKKISVGASPTSYNYAFKGKIYAIRIYNKILTAEEVAQNYSVDVARFELE